MKTLRNVSSVAELVDCIAAGSDDPKEKGPDVVLVALVSHRKTIIGSYTKDDPDIISEFTSISGKDGLFAGVNQLIDFRLPFVTQTGTGDCVCTLKWTIQD